MKKLLCLALSAGVVMGLAGCSKEEADVIIWHTSTNTDNLIDIVESFNEKYPTISVSLEYQGSYSDILSKTKTAIMGKNQPNIVFGYADHFYDYLTLQSLQELDSFTENDNYFSIDAEGNVVESTTSTDEDGNELERIGFTNADIADFGGLYSSGQIFDTTGTLYSLPFGTATEILYVNADLVRESGVVSANADYTEMAAQLATWEGVMEVARELNAAEAGERPTYSMGYDSTDNFFITLLEQAKVAYTGFDSNGEGTYDFVTTSRTDAEAVLKSVIDDNYGYITSPTQNGGYGSDNLRSKVLFANVGSTGGAKYYKDTYTDADGKDTAETFDLQMFPLPQITTEPGSRKLIQQGPNIAMLKDKAGNTDHDLYTWMFMKHMTSTDVNAEYSMSQGYIPSRQSCTETTAYQEWLSVESFQTTTMKLALADQANFYTSNAFAGSAAARSSTKTIMNNLLATEASSGVTTAFDRAKAELKI